MGYAIKFSIPLRVRVSKKDFFILNMNNYRNAHYRVLNDAKKNFNDHVFDLNITAKFTSPVQVHYKYYPASKRSYDRMNVLSVVDKFLMDALVKRGVLVDDNYKLVLTPTFEPMPPDKLNPRCEVCIKEINHFALSSHTRSNQD